MNSSLIFNPIALIKRLINSIRTRKYYRNNPKFFKADTVIKRFFIVVEKLSMPTVEGHFGEYVNKVTGQRAYVRVSFLYALYRHIKEAFHGR